jgi:hypothetical protein
MYLTAIGLAASLIAYGAAVFAGVEMLKPAIIAIAFFAAWSLLHLAGYVVNGSREVKEGCSSCSGKSFALTRRGFMGAAAWLLASLGMKGAAARILQPEVTKLEGLERINAVKRALKAKDVRNALGFIRSKGWSIDETKAEVALHKLKDGEMLAVGFPVSEKAVLVYYEYSGSSKIRSEAKVYVLKNENAAKLEFVSINGGITVQSDDCGPGLVECPQCTCVDWDVINCVIYNCTRACAFCGRDFICWLMCAAISCPEAIHWCCPQECIEIWCCPTP